MERQQTEHHLWKKAESRAAFKLHVLSYVAVNLGLWLLWYLTTSEHQVMGAWPMYISAFSALGLLVEFAGAFLNLNQHDMAQKEFEKLKRGQ